MKSAEDALRHLDGADGIVVDLQKGLATVTPRAGSRFRPAAVLGVIARAGLRPVAVTVVATGTARGGAFYLPGVADTYLSLPAPAPPDGPVSIRVRVTPDGQVSNVP